MKDFIYKIWNWLVGLLNKVRRDRLYHFIAGMIAAMLVFHEHIAWTQWVGILLIMAGCYLVVN